VKRERPRREDVLVEFDEFCLRQLIQIEAKLNLRVRRIKNYYLGRAYTDEFVEPLTVEIKK
jgi:hypothetical protein